MQTTITKGFGTWMGLAGAAAAVLVPLIGELADAAQPLGAPAWVWTISGALLACTMVLGRMAQAVANIVTPPPAAVELAVDEWPDEPTDAPDA